MADGEQEKEADQSAASTPIEGRDAESESGTGAQPATPERSEDSCQALEAQVFRLTHRNAMLLECIRIGEGLARADGYSRGYAAGRTYKRRLSARRQRASMPWAKSFPMSVGCGGRKYQASDETELDDLMMLLIDGNTKAANRYRVAATAHSRWPRPSKGVS